MIAHTDNHIIDEAIAAMPEVLTENSCRPLIDALSKRIDQHGMIMTAVTEVEQSGIDTNITVRLIDTPVAHGCLSVFTAPKGINGLAPVPIAHLLTMLQTDDDIGGLAIFAKERLIYLDRAMVDRVLDPMPRLSDMILNEGADAYEHGDFETAYVLYKQAADMGNIIAVSNLGYCHYYGRSIPKDYEKARACFETAAAENDIPAIYKLGDMYANGLIPGDPDRAYQLYKFAYELALNDTVPDLCTYPDICLRMADCTYRRNGDADSALDLLDRAIRGFKTRLLAGDAFTKGPLRRAEALKKEIRQGKKGRTTDR